MLTPDPDQSLDVKLLIDQQPFTRLQWLVLVLCVLTLAFDAIDLTVMGLVAPALSEQWHVAKAALSPALTSSIVGTCVGAAFGGPLADAVGRRRVLVGAVISFGLLTLGCAFAPTIGWLIALRFLGGLGIGSASPVANTLMSEWAPERYRALCCNVLLVGYTLGATVGGIAASWLIPHLGWQSMLVLGGGLPIVLGLVLLAIPESLPFMVVRQWPRQHIVAVLERLRPSERGGAAAVAATLCLRSGPRPSLAGIATAFNRRYVVGTGVLWLVYFLGLVIYYALTSWLPTMLHGAGFSIAQASWIMALFALGGALGTLLLGLAMGRLGVRAVALTFAASGVLIWLVGGQGASFWLLALTVFAAGATQGGALLSMPALAAGFYPTAGRAAGVSWMVGAGRVGGIFGAMACGMLLQLNWGFGAIFGMLAIPAFVAAVALLLSGGMFARPVSAPLAASPAAPAEQAL